MAKQLKIGDKAPDLHTRNIHGSEVNIPSSASPVVHLQFRRFAGCPICNLHLQEFLKRSDEIADGGIREIVVFHSTDGELLPYQGNFPFDVIGDPKKHLYREFGVGSSLSAVLSPGAWPAMVKGNLAKDKPKMPLVAGGGPFGLPADFLISNTGIVKAVRYGKHANDQWSVDEMLALALS
jgi:peroxiredoxin